MYELSKSHNETVNLGMLVNDSVIFIEKVEADAVLRTDMVVGHRFPLYCTSLGKAILAHLPEDMRDILIEDMELKPICRNPITNKDKLSLHLEEIRKKGYSVDDKEFDPHIVCVAVPVFTYSDYPTYAISLASPVSRMTPKRVSQIGKDLVSVCTRLSAQLGGSHHLKNKEIENKTQ